MPKSSAESHSDEHRRLSQTGEAVAKLRTSICRTRLFQPLCRTALRIHRASNIRALPWNTALIGPLVSAVGVTIAEVSHGGYQRVCRVGTSA